VSQQVAKNLFLSPSRSYLRKGAEAYFTLLLEVLWPKRRILETYVNIAEFGDGVFGVEAASAAYFNKASRNLTADEAALLAAVLPNPRVLTVRRPSRFVRARAAWIQRQMRQLGGSDYLRRLP
jgi:monofunctional biosynthetic peptidoglycan transglycosylase